MDTEYFNLRRTVRKYLDKNIPAELLQSMLESAMRAPTTGNMQLYSTIVTTDKEIKRRWKELINQYHPDLAQAKGASAREIEACTLKMAEINNAYEHIIKSRQAG